MKDALGVGHVFDAERHIASEPIRTLPPTVSAAPWANGVAERTADLATKGLLVELESRLALAVENSVRRLFALASWIPLTDGLDRFLHLERDGYEIDSVGDLSGVFLTEQFAAGVV